MYELDCHLIECQDRDEWLLQREKGIGASEAATVLGLSKWSSPFQLWSRKVGLTESTVEETENMYWGRRLESIIADEYMHRTGNKIEDLGEFTICQHPKYPFMLATLDRLFCDADSLQYGDLECKATSSFNREEWENEPPIYYQVQVQHQLAVTGLQKAVIAVLIGGNRFDWVEVPRNDAFIEMLIQKETEFWQMVESETAPDVDGDEATTEALKEMYPDDDGATVALPPEALAWDNRLIEIKESIKGLQAEKSAIENKLRQAIGTNSFGIISDGTKYSYKTMVKREFTVPEAEIRVLRRIKAK